MIFLRCNEHLLTLMSPPDSIHPADPTVKTQARSHWNVPHEAAFMVKHWEQVAYSYNHINIYFLIRSIHSNTCDSELLRWCNTHFFLVLASGRVQRLDQSGGVADKHGVAGGADDHTEHGEPDVWHALWSLSPISNTQHVAHGFKEGKGIELAPGVILQAHGERKRHRRKSGSNLTQAGYEEQRRREESALNRHSEPS